MEKKMIGFEGDRVREFRFRIRQSTENRKQKKISIWGEENIYIYFPNS